MMLAEIFATIQISDTNVELSGYDDAEIGLILSEIANQIDDTTIDDFFELNDPPDVSKPDVSADDSAAVCPHCGEPLNL